MIFIKHAFLIDVLITILIYVIYGSVAKLN